MSHTAAPSKSGIVAIVNPNSGSFAAQGEWLERLEQDGGHVLTSTTEAELAGALATAARTHARRIVTVGGDGSVSRVLNKLGDDRAEYEIALVPAGTGNDLARSLGLPVNDLQMAWDLALHGEAKSIDLASWSSDSAGLFGNSITAGFGGRQAAEVDPQQKSSWGKIAYWASALSQFGDMPQFDIVVQSNAEEHRLRSIGFWLANGRYVGGGFPVAPNAMLDDGLLDLVFIPALPTLELLATGIDFTVSGPEQAEQVLHFRSDHVVIQASLRIPLSIDGDPIEADRLECRVLRKVVRMVTGPYDPALTPEVP